MVNALFKTCVAAAAIALFLLGHVSEAAANNAPRPADLGPEIALASPAGAYVGRLTVTPSHGPGGTPLAVRAEGLPPGEEFALVWRTVKGSWKVADGEFHGREYTPVAYRIATVASDRNGTFTANFIAPEDFGFAHDVVLQQSDRLFTQTSFHLDMTVRLSPDSGPVGTPIRIDIKGIGWRQLQNSWLLLYDNNFTGWISSVSTGGSASFTIPATGKPGLHVMEILHGDFTFPYRNMQQSPEPDRPRFALPFMLTPGDPVLPPPPGQQAQAEVRGLLPQEDLVVTPRFSGVGEPALVLAAGMTPGRSYELNWSTVTGNRVGGRGWEQSSSAIAKAIADASGRVEFRFIVPDDLGGAHEVWIADGASRKTGSHWIVPSASPLDIGRGPAGTKFKIHLKGVGWTETANIYTVVYDNNYIGYACGFNSQGDVEITLYASGEPGWHFVDLYPAIYKGRESRPINFRLPQLTYSADHPGEDLPRFRFAFEVTESENGSPSR